MKLTDFFRAAFSAIILLSAGMLAQAETASQTLFVNVHVFDGVSEQRLEDASVLVEGNLIKKVSRDRIEAPGAKVIDGGGRTLMPGLIDAHVHMTITESIADLRDNYDWMYWGAVSTIEAEKSFCAGLPVCGTRVGPPSACRRPSIGARL